jgi:hypothetical protein
MASKKRKKKSVSKEQEFKKRSIAARKGWRKRKLKELPAKIRREQKLLANAAVITGKKSNPRIETRGKTVKQLEKLLKASEKKRKKLEQQLATSEYVDSRPLSLLKRDMTIAVEPSALRHLDERDTLLKVLKNSKKAGQIIFDKKAAEIAELYDIPIREVYTLYWSP